MIRKRRLLVECLIAAIVLAALFAAAWPRFKRAQRMHLLVTIAEDLDRVLVAMRDYQNDEGGVPYAYQPPNAQFSTNRMQMRGGEYTTLNCIRGFFEAADFDRQCRFLMRHGYLDEWPRILSDDIKRSSNPLRIFCAQIQDVQQMPTLYRFINMGYAVMWPLAKREANEALFEKVGDEFGFGFPNHEDRLYDSMMDESLYYAPSNGLRSAGFVYVDLDGNHSPWGWERLRLGVLE